MKSNAIGAAIIGATALFALSGTARANDSVTVGRGLLCDTQAQAEQFFALSTDQSTEAAFSAVNKDKKACGISTIAYIKRDTKANLAKGADAYEVARITVVGAFVNGAWVVFTPTDQYTIFKLAGQSV